MSILDIPGITRGQADTRYPSLLGERLRRAAAKAQRANSLFLGLMASPPAISTGTTNLDATLTKSYRTSTGQTSSFRITGGTPTQGSGAYAPFIRALVVTMPSGSGGNAAGDPTHTCYMWSVEFITDAPKIMLRSLAGNYMVEVDDQPVSATVLTNVGGGTVYALLDFTSAGGSAVRKIRVEYTLGTAFDGVYIGPTYTLWPPQDENNIHVTTVGDSIDTGTGSSFPNGAWNKVAGKLLGWTDVRQCAFGGTGYVNAGSFNTSGAALRVSDVVATSPDVLIISGSQNDDSSVGSLSATALTTLQAYRTALPNVPIIVMGTDAASSGPSATRLSNEAAVLSAFTTWSDSKSFYIPTSNAATGSWQTGTGTTGTTTGAGNRDRFGYDASHPNDLGHIYMAKRFAEAFRAIVLPAIR